MMECPKCGFTQPEDRYCANCGVDIANFHAKPAPIVKRLLNNPTSYGVLFIGGLIFLGIYISALPDSKIAKTAKWVLDVEGNSEEDVIAEDMNSTEEIILPNRPEPAFAENSMEPLQAKSAENINLNEEKKTPAKETALQAPQKISVNFYAFSRQSMGALYSASQVLGESSDIQILNLQKEEPTKFLQQSDPEMEALPGGKSFTIVLKQPQQFNFIYENESGEEYGLGLQVTINDSSESNIVLDYEILINLQGTEEGIGFSNSIGGSYQFSPKGGLILSGILPKQNMSEEGSRQLQASPLKIMEYEGFHSPDAQSPLEFLVLITAN